MKAYSTLNIFLLIIILFSEVKSQKNWIAPPFSIDEWNPRAFYWDKNENEFYVGGNIYSVNSITVNRTFKIDSTNKIDFLDTINQYCDVPLAFTRYHDTIYHAGFTGVYINKNGNWSPKVVGGAFKTLEVYDGDLLIGGLFQDVISSNDGCLIRFDGVNFYPFYSIDSVLNKNEATINAIQEYKGKLYLGGNFQGGKFNEIISWDGSKWDDLDSGLYGVSGTEGVLKMAIYKDELYIGGSFGESSGSRSNNIIKWNGTNWVNIGNGIYGQGVGDMKVFNDELWVVGALDSVDGLKLDNVAIWNGISWCKIEGEVGDYPLVIEEYRDTLYIGGNFQYINMDPKLGYIAKINPDANRVCAKPIGVHEVSKAFQYEISVYPNPASSFIYLESLENTEQMQFRIIDLNGKVISTGAVCNRKINVAEIPKGMVLLELNITSQTVRKKVIISQ